MSLPIGSPTRRTLLGLLFLLHGLAHSALGMWASAYGPDWVVTPLWLLAEVGFIVAGLGLLGVSWCRRIWEYAALVGALSSILLFDFFGHVALGIGLALDAFLLVIGLRWGESALFAPTKQTTRAPAGRGRVRRAVRTTAHALATLGVVWVALVIALRPWHMRWGASPADLVVRLPGDELVGVAHYRMDHVVDVAAPADSVWPWIVQIGQDRGGFYSYDWLERLVGDDVHNATRIHPEWQVRQEGDLVRATQAGYLGGRLGNALGWRVLQIQPRRALVLEGWGAFVLQPLDSATTRLHVRIRGAGRPSVTGSLLAPFGLLVFEPAHFIMERGMLLGIKARAEGRTRVSAAGP